MRRTVDDDACTIDRGQILPPVDACRRGLVALALVAALILAGACSSGSSAAKQATVGSTALTIPSPFELGQQVGVGDVTIQATSFRHKGDSLSVSVAATNTTAQPLSIDPAKTFTIFYGTGRHSPTTVTGGAAPVAPRQRETITLEFAVPAQYQYPLLWFSPATSGAPPATIILRGTGSPA
jgi:hypothetical protein